jgi:serine O-acetyltransferase
MTDNKIAINTLINQLSFFGPLNNPELNYLHDYFEEARKISAQSTNLYVGIPKIFDFFQTHHHILFLYTFARLLYEKNVNNDLCTKLFLLNRMMNGVDLFYKIKMPKYFLLGHGIGTVFSRAMYGNYLVVFQNSTIGIQDQNYPEIGDKVIIFPNCVIAGKTKIGNNCVVGAGTILINKIIPDDSIVYGGEILRIKHNSKNLISDYFDIQN